MRGEVIVDDLVRRGRRSIVEAQDWRVEIIAAVEAEIIGGLVEADCVFGAIGAGAHDDARQAVFALHAGEIILLRLHAEQERARAVGNDFFPLVARGRVHRRLHQLEVDGAIQIGRDVEMPVPMHDGIFIVGLARGDGAQRRVQFIGLEPVDFRCRVTGGTDEDDFFAGALVDADKEAGVFFFIEKRVFACRQVALVDGVGPGILVAVDPDDGLTIGRPFEAAIGVVDDGGGFRAGLDILNVDLVELAALRVGRIGDQLMVGAGVDAAEREIVLVFAHCVAVEQDRLGGVGIEGVGCGAAGDDRVFAALAV